MKRIAPASPTRSPRPTSQRNPHLDPSMPYAWLVEPECASNRQVVQVATLFLTNRECPFDCVMCDLWKNTLERSVAVGDIPAQIRYAFERLPAAQHIKLYNSGNFFDPQAIPAADHDAIAELVRSFDTVIVENHPRLCGDACFRFQEKIAPARLEIAIGLETCNAKALHSLNKSMTLDDFEQATERLHDRDIRTRVFLLHGAPFIPLDETTDWTLRSIAYAFDHGVDCCSVIATRDTTGPIALLRSQGDFVPASGASLEHVQTAGIAMQRGRVLIDLWEIEPFFPCDACRDSRIARMHQMNLGQVELPHVRCDSCRTDASRTHGTEAHP